MATKSNVSSSLSRQDGWEYPMYLSKALFSLTGSPTGTGS